jgi:soluble P-type ATPase
MIEVEIPGRETLRIKYLVLDYNGTLAVDGELLPGVKECLNDLANDLEIHVVTADTFGKAKAGLEGVKCELAILPAGNQDQAKLEFIEELGNDFVAAGGNGRNDMLMLNGAALGIAVIQEEGASIDTLLAADVVCPDIVAGLNLLRNPLRLKATLRK